MVLHVASNMGFTRLTGVEYGKTPFELSVRNIGNVAHLIHGDAREVDLSRFRGLVFFSPFRAELALEFFERLPSEIEVILTVNHDRVIEPVLSAKGFTISWSYRHRVYENFNAKLWHRDLER